MRAKNEVQAQTGHRSRRGFTLFEILISTFVAGLALVATMIVATQMTSQLRGERSQVDAVDNARVALEEITRTLRAAGTQVDRAQGQQRLLYAGPFTVAMNANLTPAIDPDGTAEPAALDPALGSLPVLLGNGLSYSAPLAYTTGAETIVLTLDSDRDGFISAADAQDDEEEDTSNPNDFVLKGFVYGSNGSTNTVTEQGFAVVRGPLAAEDGSLPEPLFSYWIDEDNDPATPPVLHGDLDGDRELSESEIAGMTPVSNADLAFVERIDVAATAETAEKVKSSQTYVQSTLRSTVTFRDRKDLPVRVMGVVFADFNQNGMRDPEDTPLEGVVVQCSSGYRTKTDAQGAYALVLSPGAYKIQEWDLPGYSSTTPNTILINPSPGDYVVVDFGDFAAKSSGLIFGRVYNDENRSGKFDLGEAPIQGVRLQLDTGVSTFTDSKGQYIFRVDLGDYTVTEIDSSGFSSSTPNAVDVSLTARGDSVRVDFGDFEYETSGEIVGVVFLDENNNGVRDDFEVGIANVTIMLDDTESTVTNSNGEFSFTAPPGEHQVTQVDLPDHTSSTVNTVYVTVIESKSVAVEFGDLSRPAISFQEIELADTERVLSIATLDFGEDLKNDMDMILGTHSSAGSNDLIGWWNKRKNGSTPNSGIFDYRPDQQRWIDLDVNSIAKFDLNRDGRDDLVTGLAGGSNNIAIWVTQGSGLQEGMLPNSPSSRFSTTIATAVNDVVVGHFDGDAMLDLAIGTRTGVGSGRLEIWHGRGGVEFSRERSDVYSLVPGLDVVMGEVASLAASDFTDDGIDDLVVATRLSESSSRVYLLIYDSLTYGYTVQAGFEISGQVQDVLALDMMEDDQGDVDIVVATALSPTTGEIQLWHNRGTNRFGVGPTPNLVPNDHSDPDGAPLSLAAAHIDTDVFPDILVGTRASLMYEGQVQLYRTFGFLPSHPTPLSASTTLGEVVAIATGDFNKDGEMDLTTATRTSGATGKVIVFFNGGQAGL